MQDYYLLVGPIVLTQSLLKADRRDELCLTFTCFYLPSRVC